MKPGLVIRPATPEDADLLAPRLRREDREEIYAVTGCPPLPVLRDGVASSDPCLAATDGAGLVMALFGVIPGPAGCGKIWLLGAPELLRRRFSVRRWSHTWIALLHRRYATLWNYVDPRNRAHVRWLQACGFVLTPAGEYGFERRPFYRLEKHATGSASHVLSTGSTPSIHHNPLKTGAIKFEENCSETDFSFDCNNPVDA